MIRKPDWLRIHLGSNQHFATTSKIVKDNCLHTICESGRCPNLGECWNQKTATFMIAGDICTRSCKFCNTKSGKPLPLNPDEPLKIAQSIQLLGLKHAVITSVDRDDLPDSGAGHWAETIRQIQKINPNTTIEVLIPDFRGNAEHLKIVLQTQPNIISHNMETVKRLTPIVRSVANYERSLGVLKQISESSIAAKSGLMLGLGEKKAEVIQTMNDLLEVGCHYLSIGQYLQPSRKNIPVTEYIHPEQFEEYRTIAQSLGFKHVESAPLVRSSYHSGDYVKK